MGTLSSTLNSLLSSSEDIYRLESRSGIISGGMWIVDHRLKTNKAAFAPRSISIYKTP